jgi:hypothetical protein
LIDHLASQILFNLNSSNPPQIMAPLARTLRPLVRAASSTPLRAAAASRVSFARSTAA